MRGYCVGTFREACHGTCLNLLTLTTGDSATPCSLSLTGLCLTLFEWALVVQVLLLGAGGGVCKHCKHDHSHTTEREDHCAALTCGRHSVPGGRSGSSGGEAPAVLLGLPQQEGTVSVRGASTHRSKLQRFLTEDFCSLCHRWS